MLTTQQNMRSPITLKPILLSIVELGGYPDFKTLYESLGYEVVTIQKMRTALRFLKDTQPSVIVAEFNFQSDFRDRTSSLESMLASIQRYPKIRVIVFYEKEYLHQFEKLKQRFSFDTVLSFPISESELESALQRSATST